MMIVESLGRGTVEQLITCVPCVPNIWRLKLESRGVILGGLSPIGQIKLRSISVNVVPVPSSFRVTHGNHSMIPFRMFPKKALNHLLICYISCLGGLSCYILYVLIWLFGYLLIWSSDYLPIWMSGYLLIWISDMVIYAPENMVIWCDYLAVKTQMVIKKTIVRRAAIAEMTWKMICLGVFKLLCGRHNH